METKHTALPWHVGHIGQDEFRKEIVFDTNHGQVAETLETSDAAFIVKAINCHYELLETLKQCGMALRFYAHWMNLKVPGTDYPFGKDCERLIETALAKADGTPEQPDPVDYKGRYVISE
jgi:hypothetical protein